MAAKKPQIRFVDTTLRDGALSLWASNITTPMMLPIIGNLDRAGFIALELTSSSYFKKMVRELKEDPWERIRQVARRLPNTPLRIMTSRINTFNYDPPSMFQRFLELIREAGIEEIRLLDPWNEVEGFKWRVDLARECGLKPILSITYSVSPRHTDEHFAERIRAAAAMNIHRLCLKDPGGLLTPERTRSLVPVFLEAAGEIPVELHVHCTTGLGPLVAMEAIKLGVYSVDTAIPPLANASSNPSVFNVAANARALGVESLINEDELHPAAKHLTEVAERHGFPQGVPVQYDHAQFLHQIPGGMISNLEHQLGLVGLGDKMDEALAETARVRQEFGFPIMVTPLSQFVGSQAAINVILGERYKEVTDQSIEYALGHWGAEAIQEMDPNVRDIILDRPRAREIALHEDPDPSLAEMRAKFGGPDMSDEEMLLCWLTSDEDVAAMRAAPKSSGGQLSARQPLTRLIETLSQRDDCCRIHITKPGLSLVLEK